MKTIFITLILLLFSFCLKAQNDKSITIGKKEVITSTVLNENRTLWIYTPNSSSLNPDEEKRYVSSWFFLPIVNIVFFLKNWCVEP
jgi:uncharacterized protein